ncbi:MAG: general secretion pathway protein GspB [Marinobacter sp.]|nr:general secretion pathway protein GspB [Marinobacter sp.]
MRYSSRMMIPTVMLAMLLATVSQAELRDPTRPAEWQRVVEPADVAPQNYTLDSILLGGQRRTAIINGIPRREGEQFDGARLQRIHADRVSLLVEGVLQELHLPAPPQIRHIP